MGRSRRLTLANWTSANDALQLRFSGVKAQLAKKEKMSRTTVTNFFNAEPISENSFRKICTALRLNWQHVSSEDFDSDSLDHQHSVLALADEGWIDEVKERCYQRVLKRHSQIRLLNGTEIRVDQLYVDVWLLKKPERRDFSTSESILDRYDIEKDCLCLSKRIQRKPGFEIANSKPKLIIMGKPGSGKTTFLKHLAIDWVEGKFQADKISILIELRQIREQKWQLIDAISQELELTKEETLGLLKQGKLLVLMDGLDEVPTGNLRASLLEQLKEVSENYSNENRIIITCRTQVIGRIPSGFTEVEVAEFNPKQVRQFVQNWFAVNGQSEAEVIEQSEAIQIAMTNQPDLREMTVTPVLLSLICVVWQDNGNIPTNKANLYEKGINWLLSHWNDNKEIPGWAFGTEAYRQLSVKDKEELLIEIAAQKFENPNNFVLFEQSELVKQISQKIGIEDQERELPC